MSVWICTTSWVSGPYIVSHINELKWEIERGIVEEPGASIIYKAMLHYHWLFLDTSWCNFRSLPWHAECLENVAIFCDYVVLLVQIPPVLNLLLKSPVECLGVRERFRKHISLEAIPHSTARIEDVSLILWVEGPVQNEVSCDCNDLVHETPWGIALVAAAYCHLEYNLYNIT